MDIFHPKDLSQAKDQRIRDFHNQHIRNRYQESLIYFHLVLRVLNREKITNHIKSIYKLERCEYVTHIEFARIFYPVIQIRNLITFIDFYINNNKITKEINQIIANYAQVNKRDSDRIFAIYREVNPFIEEEVDLFVALYPERINF